MISFACAIAISLTSQASRQSHFVIHAPTDTSPTDVDNLMLFGANAITRFKPTQDWIEDANGNVAIKVGTRDFVVVSNRSMLQIPLLMFREMVTLSKLRGERELISLKDLSPYARQEFIRQLSEEDNFKIKGNECFALRPHFDNQVRGRSFELTSSTNPPRFSEAEKEAESTFTANLIANGFRSKSAAERSPDSRTPIFNIKDQVVYDNFSSTKEKVDLDRKGLEIFRIYYDVTCRLLDEQVYSRFASDPKWSPYLASRKCHSISEISQVAPTVYKILKQDIGRTYLNLGFSTQEAAEADFESASVTNSFTFTAMFGDIDNQGRLILNFKW